ncbi:alpha-glucoside-specific PTS transporter subunit IIBC [Sporolactobacillus terrae]|uniref:alpha-glucoside-specific PTS transporter subunit IIBC n=1 Tax=Sporolactobacillus terrae TaxID=269673 RepID=UPI00111A273F|nr:alpha-glucoside-specific PTS transporter subunit IIBC [Sporolactobacillus terrae]
MMQKIQRFGGAMFTPVLLFAFSGLMLALSISLTNPILLGSVANEGTLWTQFWSMIENGAWTIFNQMELLFVIGLPIGLAKEASGRAAMESVVVYLTFNYFVNSILTSWGGLFGVDFSQDLIDGAAGSGLKMIAGIKTLDTSVLGALVIAGITVWIHNRYFSTKLPDWLGVFQGSSFVVIIGFFVMIPVAFLFCWIWPIFQGGIASLQHFMATSGVLGVWIYCFLERLLIPTGLHHFIYIPFMYGPAAVDGGIVKYWFSHMQEFADSTKPLKELFPEGGFALYGNEKIFAPPGIAAAFYFTAKPEKRRKVLALLIPATLTAMLVGITEPFEFTFLFAAPLLFVVHAILAATMDAAMFFFGVVGRMTNGIIDMMTTNWIPLFANHWMMYLTQIVIGLIFTCIYFFVFRFLILKFNFPTPGREADDEETKLFTKQDYRNKDKKHTPSAESTNQYATQAATYLDAFGGYDNISDVTNCATRLRITVKDESLVGPDRAFKQGGAHGVVRHGKAFQVIVGLSVPQVREEFEKLMQMGIK